jgi:hypothetical protein
MSQTRAAGASIAISVASLMSARLRLARPEAQFPAREWTAPAEACEPIGVTIAAGRTATDAVRGAAARVAARARPQPACAGIDGGHDVSARLVPRDGPISPEHRCRRAPLRGLGRATAGSQRAAHSRRPCRLYPEQPVSAAELRPYRAGLDRLLEAHQPYPGLVCDRHWTVVACNNACASLFSDELLGANLLRGTSGPGR